MLTVGHTHAYAPGGAIDGTLWPLPEYVPISVPKIITLQKVPCCHPVLTNEL